MPSRGLIGYHGEFLTDTRGTGVLNRVFHGWAPHKGPIPGRRNGVLISMEDGVSVPYALFNLEDRGRFFIGAGEQVYTGMILGEHNRDNDLEVNPLKGKKLTNVRASGKDEAVRADHAGPADAGAGDRLRRGRRAGRGDPAPHPAAQAPPRPARAQAAVAAEGRVSRDSTFATLRAFAFCEAALQFTARLSRASAKRGHGRPLIVCTRRKLPADYR